MQMNFDDLMQKVTDFLQSEARTETIMGEPFKLGEFTCVPVIKTGMGFGSGGGTNGSPKNGQSSGGGAGAGVGIVPIGFLVSRADEISFISTQKSSGLSKVFEEVPGLIKKYMDDKKESEADTQMEKGG